MRFRTVVALSGAPALALVSGCAKAGAAGSSAHTVTYWLWDADRLPAYQACAKGTAFTRPVADRKDLTTFSCPLTARGERLRTHAPRDAGRQRQPRTRERAEHDQPPDPPDSRPVKGTHS